jgi:hypothetical protein
MDTPSNGVTTLEDGVLTLSALLDIDALSDYFVVAVGEDGVILYSTDGETFNLLTTSPVGVGVDILCVAIKSKLEWWIGTSSGRMYYTEDAGAHWTAKTFAFAGVGRVEDIKIQNDSIMYMAFTHSAPSDNAHLYASFNGGYDWVAMPLGTGVLPAAVSITSLAVCEADPEFVMGGGLQSGVDGIILVGKM